MPNPIQLLPPHIANQIAAGEVIQRPASAVKELLENAVDAGATEIKLILVDAGKSLIQVIDNGKGMGPVDARNCFERHATSKISAIEDLFTIKTMGFRGEALASIAAVAQVSMKTKTAEQELGTAVEIENSVIIPPCYVGKNVKISNSVIGPHVSLGAGTEVVNSNISNSIVQQDTSLKNVVMADSMIGSKVVYKGQTLDLSLGDFTTIS
jgi:DNA mismatch repair ATPase MutL